MTGGQMGGLCSGTNEKRVPNSLGYCGGGKKARLERTFRAQKSHSRKAKKVATSLAG